MSTVELRYYDDDYDSGSAMIDPNKERLPLATIYQKICPLCLAIKAHSHFRDFVNGKQINFFKNAVQFEMHCYVLRLTHLYFTIT